PASGRAPTRSTWQSGPAGPPPPGRRLPAAWPPVAAGAPAAPHGRVPSRPPPPPRPAPHGDFRSSGDRAAARSCAGGTAGAERRPRGPPAVPYQGVVPQDELPRRGYRVADYVGRGGVGRQLVNRHVRLAERCRAEGSNVLGRRIRGPCTGLAEAGQQG